MSTSSTSSSSSSSSSSFKAALARMSQPFSSRNTGAAAGQSGLSVLTSALTAVGDAIYPSPTLTPHTSCAPTPHFVSSPARHPSVADTRLQQAPLMNSTAMKLSYSDLHYPNNNGGFNSSTLQPSHHLHHLANMVAGVAAAREEGSSVSPPFRQPASIYSSSSASASASSLASSTSSASSSAFSNVVAAAVTSFNNNNNNNNTTNTTTKLNGGFLAPNPIIFTPSTASISTTNNSISSSDDIIIDIMDIGNNTNNSNGITDSLSQVSISSSASSKQQPPMVASRKRKMSTPVPSIQASSMSDSEKMEQKIFKLDVFKVFYQKPKTLLYRPNAGGRPRSASTMSYTTRGGGGAMGSRTMGTRRHHSSQPFSLSEEALALPLSRLDGGSSGGGVAHYRKPTKPRSYSSGYGPGHVGKSLNVDTNIMKSLPNYFKDPAIKDSVDLTLFKETKRAPAIQWKGHPLSIDPSVEGYSDLTNEEIKTCSTLRILPGQYFHIKETLLKAAFKGPYKKRDAQGWFRIDVNKTNKVYDWFVMIGWIPDDPVDWYAKMARFSRQTPPSSTSSSSASPSENSKASSSSFANISSNAGGGISVCKQASFGSSTSAPNSSTAATTAAGSSRYGAPPAPLASLPITNNNGSRAVRDEGVHVDF